MDFLQTNHHAFIVVGPRAATFPKVVSYVERELGLEKGLSPDTYILEKNSLSVDDARKIKQWQTTLPEKAARKCAIVSVFTLNREAQNALLKTLEEPSGHTVIILCVDTLVQLLPTIISRAQVVHSQEEKIDIPLYVHEILKLPPGQRLAHSAFTKLVTKKNSEEKMDRESMLMFLHAVEYVVHEKSGIKDGPLAKPFKDGLEAILFAKKYARDTSASLKMLLEFVLLSVPKIS